MWKIFASAILSAKIFTSQKPNPKNFASPILNAKNFASVSHHQFSMRKFFVSVTLSAKNFASTTSNFRSTKCQCENFASASNHAKPIRNANDHLCKFLTVRRETKSHLKSLFKGLQLTISHNHLLLQKTHCRLAKQIPRHSTPRGRQEEEGISASRPY